MKVDAIWVVEPNKIEIRPQEIRDEPLADEVQIDVKACGVCAWDSYLYQGISGPGDPPYPIGHEAVGIVTKVGQSVTNLKVGDKVFVGSGTYTNQMSKVINNKASGLGKLPDNTTDFTKCVYEPTCCVVNLLHLSRIEPGDRVVLVGAGYMGLITLMGLSRGSQAGYVTAFETQPERMLLAQKYGADFVFDPYSEAGKKHIAEIQAAGGADLVIDFAGTETGYEVATSVLKDQGGRLTLGTWHRHTMQFDGTRWHMGGVTVYNLAPMSNRHYHEIVAGSVPLLEKKIYQPEELITHVANYRDKDLADIFLKSISKEDGYMKGVITFDD